MSRRVSVIIPNLDSPVVDRAVGSVAAQRGAGAHEVIVVGRDGPRRLANVSGVRYVETGPLLPGAARNRGMSEATGDVFAFIDADCIADPGWLEAHVARHAAGEHVVGGGVRWDDDNYWRSADNLSMFHAFHVSSPAGPRPFLPTLNLSVSRRAVSEVGGMDPRYRCGEDVDWTIRLARGGYRPWFEPGAVVRHHPPRLTFRDAMVHWARSGRWMPGIRRRHADVFGTPGWLLLPPIVAALSPWIAAWATARIYRPGAAGRAHWSTLPAVLCTKWAWCLGALRPLDPSPAGPWPVIEPPGG